MEKKEKRRGHHDEGDIMMDGKFEQTSENRKQKSTNRKQETEIREHTKQETKIKK